MNLSRLKRLAKEQLIEDTCFEREKETNVSLINRSVERYDTLIKEIILQKVCEIIIDFQIDINELLAEYSLQFSCHEDLNEDSHKIDINLGDLGNIILSKDKQSILSHNLKLTEVSDLIALSQHLLKIQKEGQKTYEL